MQQATASRTPLTVRRSKSGNKYWFIPTLAVLLVVGVLASLAIGAVRINPLAVIADSMAGVDHVHNLVLWNIRLPRTLMAALTGALLALTGAAMQALFRNPLAEPSLLGVSGGGTVGAAVAIVLGSSWLGAELWAQLEVWALPLMAFAGSLLFTLAVFMMAGNRGVTSMQNLLLSGVALNALAGALVGIVTLLATDAQSRSLTFWTMGSFSASRWHSLGLVLLLSSPIIIFLLRQPRRLDLLLLGEAEASHLGLRVERFKWQLVILTALGIGTAVAFSGMVGFIGLVAPHAIRMVLGPGHKTLLPAAAMAGALLATLADTLARTIAAPVDVPLGVLLAFVGVPFFLYLIRTSKTLRG